MRDTGESPIAAASGETMSFYASGAVASAIKDCIKKAFGADHGAKSKWFIEAAQRDLRARGMPDGSEPATAREELVRSLLEAAQRLSDEQLQAKVAEMAGAAVALAGVQP